MKITIEREVKTIQEAYEFVESLLPKTRVPAEKPTRIVKRYPATLVGTELTKPPVRNYDANKVIISYVRMSGRKGRTTEDMARDLANLGAGKNRFYFAQKAYELLSRRRLARFTGEHGQYVYIMPYYRKGAMFPKPYRAPKPKPQPVVETSGLFRPPVVKHSKRGQSGTKEILAAAQLVLEDRKEKGALFGEIHDLVKPSLKRYSRNYPSAMVSYLTKKGVIVARDERTKGLHNRYRYYLPQYAPAVQ